MCFIADINHSLCRYFNFLNPIIYNTILSIKLNKTNHQYQVIEQSNLTQTVISPIQYLCCLIYLFLCHLLLILRSSVLPFCSCPSFVVAFLVSHLYWDEQQLVHILTLSLRDNFVTLKPEVSNESLVEITHFWLKLCYFSANFLMSSDHMTFYCNQGHVLKSPWDHPTSTTPSDI